MRKKRGPTEYLQWQEAVKQPLTAEHSCFLALGGCKVRSQYPHIFNLISDYVTCNFNACAQKVTDITGGASDAYALRAFSAKLRRIFFYRKLKFISSADSRRLTDALCDAVNEILNKLSEITDVDVIYETGVIKRMLREAQ